MKKEYDVSKGIRGRSYKRDAKLNPPLYPDADNRRSIESLTPKPKSDMNEVGNDLIRGSRKIAESSGWFGRAQRRGHGM
jgi:hypothetical protein